MSNKKVTFILFPLFATLCSAAAGLAIGEPAPDFSIADQYDHPVKLSTFRGTPVLLVDGDRKGSDYMKPWIRGVKDAVNTAGVKVIEVASLNTVPTFMHSFVKGRFQGKDPKGNLFAPVVLDWDGRIAKTYGFKADLTNVYLIDAGGRLQYSAAGKGIAEETEGLAQAIAKLPPSDGSSPQINQEKEHE
jgi:hypothetical protein